MKACHKLQLRKYLIQNSIRNNSNSTSLPRITSNMLNRFLLSIFLFHLLQLFPAVLSGHSGWFASVRGGEQLNPHSSSIYPRALSNIAYAYGHIKDTDDEEVVNAKLSAATSKKWSDEEYEEEDHFFHSLYHNNDERVVTNVSIKKKDTAEDVESEAEDEVMFKRLNDKIFHRRRDGEEKKEGGDNDREVANMRYGLEEVFEDASFFE